MEERGLDLTQPLPERGTFSWQKLSGEYVGRGTMDASEFAALNGEHIKVLDNGEYTLGIVTVENGIKVVNNLNCNVRTRPVYEYFSTRQELN